MAVSENRVQGKNKVQSKIKLTVAVISILHWLAAPAMAQAPDDKPIDIQAEEQEFAEDHVIARGKVRVSFKDSIVNAPVATLFRDPQGQPQKAI
ncbi:MAG TPA: hypothetical protein V6C72_01570, partial [Chroococcales cyanobacterium]